MPTPPRRTVSLTFAVLGLLGARALLAQQARPPRALRDLPAYASQAVTDWGIPGFAIAVVKDDSVVFAQGFGVRKLGDPAPVTPRTLFASGSCTKAGEISFFRQSEATEACDAREFAAPGNS